MPQKGDVFDLRTNEYIEYLEDFNDELAYVIHYTREPLPSLAELKLHKLVDKNSLDGEYRKVGPNEKDRLMAVYRRAIQKRSPELEELSENS